MRLERSPPTRHALRVFAQADRKASASRSKQTARHKLLDPFEKNTLLVIRDHYVLRAEIDGRINKILLRDSFPNSIGGSFA